MGLAETKEAIEAAATAFKTWSKTTAKVRLKLLFPALTVLNAPYSTGMTSSKSSSDSCRSTRTTSHVSSYVSLSPRNQGCN